MGLSPSVDGGESWTPLRDGLDHGVIIKAFDGVLYAKRGNDMNSPSPLLRQSTVDSRIRFIRNMPAFGKIGPGNKVRTINRNRYPARSVHDRAGSDYR